MEVKNFLLVSEKFLPAFEKLLRKEIPAKTCLQLSAAYDEIVSQITVVQRTRKAIAEKYAAKNEDGTVKIDELGNVVFPDDETKTKALKEIDEILNESLELALNKVVLNPEDKMTTEEYIMLRDIVEIPEG